MNVIWFANDIPMPDDLSVMASALELPPGPWPYQIVVNGYSYSRQKVYFADYAERAAYTRDHDGATLTILRDKGE